MSLNHSVASTSAARIQALKIKHKHLSEQIEREQSHPSVSDFLVSGLKREKLRLKEQIEGIEKAS